MENVKQFGNELSSIHDSRPPVSRAKMGSITKLAMKAHKYYKHIVMLVEKFISKSNSEYKVPGLYVIDSIVRQSRHQFGTKDSFGPRFTKNFEKTFLHLFQCPEEDKPKMVRVLNLWQRNEVFPSEVIQPLLALAASSSDPVSPHKKPKHSERHRDRAQFGVDRLGDRPHPQLVEGVEPGEGDPAENPNLDLNTATTIIQQQQEQISALLQQQQQLQSQATSLLAPALSSVLAQQQTTGGVQQLEALSSLLQQTQQLQQLQAIQQRLANGNEVGGAVGGVPAQMSNVESVAHDSQPAVFNEAVLDDFDYSDEEDTLVQANRQLARQKERERDSVKPTPPLFPHTNDSASPGNSSPRRQEPPPISEALFPPNDAHRFPPVDSAPPPPLVDPLNNEGRQFPREMGGVNPPLPPLLNQFSPALPPGGHPNYPHHGRGPPGPPGHLREWPRPPLPPPHFPPPPRSPSPRMRRESRFSSPPPPLLGRRSPSPPPHHRPPWRDRERSTRWSPPPPPRRRSRSPPMMMRSSRDRSRSPPTHPRWHRVATPPQEQERRRRGVPFPREKHMTVCSITLWVGHLSKLATKETVKEAFEDFGQIKSIELVQARGCAYLVMVHRNDAIRALNSLRDLKLGGSTCKLAWAPGRGVKGAGLKAFWDQEVGSSYIPWSFVKSQSDINSMGDGGWIDAGTVPPGFTLPPSEEDPTDEEAENAAVSPAQVESTQPPPPQHPVPNMLPHSQQNLGPPTAPPRPPVPSFPRLTNPTASFQAPRDVMQHFPPRGVPNSPQQQAPVFSQANGIPFHGGIRPPMGGEPQLQRPPPVMRGGPPSMAPPMGGVPHSMAPPISGVPHSMAPLMGGVPHSMTHHMGSVPQQHMPMQIQMHQPPTMGNVPLGVPPQTTQHLMVQPPAGNVHPFLPHIGPRLPLTPPISQGFPCMGGEQTGPPMRPFMPFREPPHSGPSMAPRMGEGPPPPFVHQPPKPLDNQGHIMSPVPVDSDQILPPHDQTLGEEPQDSLLVPVPMEEEEEATELVAMDEEVDVPKPTEEPVFSEQRPSSQAEERKEPIPPLMGDEPKAPIPPPVGDEPKEPLLGDEPKEPLLPLMGEEPKEPLPPPIGNVPKSPPRGEEPKQMEEAKLQDKDQSKTKQYQEAPKEPLLLQTDTKQLEAQLMQTTAQTNSWSEMRQKETIPLPSQDQYQPPETNPLPNATVPLETTEQPIERKVPQSVVSEPKGAKPDEENGSEDDMQIETTDEEDFRINTATDDSDFL